MLSVAKVILACLVHKMSAILELWIKCALSHSNQYTLNCCACGLCKLISKIFTSSESVTLHTMLLVSLSSFMYVFVHECVCVYLEDTLMSVKPSCVCAQILLCGLSRTRVHFGKEGFTSLVHVHRLQWCSTWPTLDNTVFTCWTSQI